MNAYQVAVILHSHNPYEWDEGDSMSVVFDNADDIYCEYTVIPSIDDNYIEEDTNAMILTASYVEVDIEKLDVNGEEATEDFITEVTRHLNSFYKLDF